MSDTPPYRQAHTKPEDAALRAAWQGLADESANMPTPDILPRLRDRLPTTARPAKRASWGSIATAGVAVYTLGLLAWGLKNPGKTPEATTVHPHAVALLPANKATTDAISLTEMLQKVRWRSSEERSPHGEPPAYNETTRALLLPEKGNAP